MTEVLIFLKKSPNFHQKKKSGKFLSPLLDSDFSLVAIFFNYLKLKIV
jgi:hypothetical protein